MMRIERCILFFVIAFISINVNGDEIEQQINIGQKPNHGTHYNQPIQAEQPDVYINYITHEIIIDGLGVVSYYDVEIASASTWYVLISTQVDGDYDTIDISSLPDDYYCITIETPNGNTYEGFFYNY